MREEDLKRELEKLNPDDETKKRIFERISMKMKASASPKASAMKALLAIAACFVVLIGTTVSIDAATGGGVQRFIGGLFGFNTNTEEVASEAELAISHGMIYAPDIIYLDSKMLLFSTGRGILVYDRVYDSLAQTVDLQQSGCIYWNTDALDSSLRSHAYYEDGTLYVFNEKENRLAGPVFEYDLGGNSDVLLVQDTETAESVFERWKAFDEESYVGTFETFEETGLTPDKRHPNDQMVYSRRTLTVTDDNGKEHLCYLTVPTDDHGNPTENKYHLNIHETDSESVTQFTLRITDSHDETAAFAAAPKALPPFEYTGDDEALKAICDHMLPEYSTMFAGADEEDAVFIPAYDILARKERDGRLYVFGDYYVFGYYLNGNTLEMTSGGSFPARVTLNDESGAYEVEDVIVAGDGELYDRDIRAFTEGDGFDGVYWLFYPSDYEAAEERKINARKMFIRMYEEENSLGIEYFKDYGWEPVRIFDD